MESKLIINAEIGQITLLDQRYYPVKYKRPIALANKKAKPQFETVEDEFPSVNTYLEIYPKGVGYDLFLKKYGEIADKMFTDAGELGDNVHEAIKMILDGKTLEYAVIDGKGIAKEGKYSTEEWVKLNAWAKWLKDMNPSHEYSEEKVFSIEHRYAGTLDFIGKDSKGRYFIADWKTGNNIYEKYYLQLAAYWHAVEEMTELKIAYGILLHLNPTKYYKNLYKDIIISPDEMKEYFTEFLHWKRAWEYVNPNPKPNYKRYPLSFDLKSILGDNGQVSK